jgi:hypothetical protein
MPLFLRGSDAGKELLIAGGRVFDRQMGVCGLGTQVEIREWFESERRGLSMGREREV